MGLLQRSGPCEKPRDESAVRRFLEVSVSQSEMKPARTDDKRASLVDRFLSTVESVGNKLPDPALLFVYALLVTWVMSLLLSGIAFGEIDPRTKLPIVVVNQLSGAAIVTFLSNMVTTFVTFPPLGVVLVALLGVGVAEHTGFVNAALKALLDVTPKKLLSPTMVFIGIMSHTTADAGYVLVIPLAGIIFAAAGRHPLAGIAAAFAGVSGGFGANFIPSSLDPLLQGFTQSAAQIIDPARTVNPLCNWWFQAASGVVIVALGWLITDRVVEPRLRHVVVDGDPADIPKVEDLVAAQKKGLFFGVLSMVLCFLVLVLAALPSDSPLRAPDGSISSHAAPMMKAIVPFIFFAFLVPGVVYGVIAGTVKSHRDVVKAMSKSMGTMSYYLVLAFCCALFTDAFKQSNLGALTALYGAAGLKALAVPPGVTVVGIIVMTGGVNLLIGSASAKWALLAPIFVPMLMQLGISPELTQAAFKVGDSTTNIITPLMPYFPLVVVYCQRYVKNTGIGTLVSTMLPYSITFLVVWIVFMLGYWSLGFPLGLQAPYTYP
jgi:aminobenzoyl-glutamate transport protein